MKISNKALLALCLASTTTSSLGRVVGRRNTETSSCQEEKTPSKCNSQQDSDTHEQCVWCKSGAIPSACYTSSQSKQLPSAVFQCDSIQEDKAKSGQSYSFIEGVTHTLTGDEVDRNFCDPDSKSLSGYMELTGSKYDSNSQNKNLFYWFFEKRHTTKPDPKIPFIVWLTGGPGCSSSMALLTENGPCSVNPEGTGTVRNPYSWTEGAHVLWLDQPAGVGFSYGVEDDYNEEMVSEDAYYFMQSFYKSHPEYKENPLFVVGESYGGHYAPAITHKIFMENKNLKEGLVKINLGGLGVGNGLTNPEEQYKWYPSMAFGKNSHGIKVISESTYEAMEKVVPGCTAAISKCNAGDSAMDKFACQGAFTLCNIGLTSPYQATGLNPYDIRKKCEVRPLCYDFSNVNKFMNLESTRTALHVSDKASSKWSSCNYLINMKFHTDWMKDFSPYVADLLNGGVPVLIYAGDVDFICNYLGNEAWTKKLKWNHEAEFNAVVPHEWNEKKGLARSSNNFTFLQVYDAGHMVPSDQPEASLTMIKTFTNGEAF